MDEREQFELIPITVLVPIELEEDKPEDVALSGFLTSQNCAMYFDPKYGDLAFAGVGATEQLGVYRTTTTFVLIGRISEDEQPAEVIHALADKLYQMTAYDFMAEVVLNLQYETDLDDWIIPILLRGGGENGQSKK